MVIFEFFEFFLEVQKMETMIDRFYSLMDEKNMKAAQTAREVGISPSAFTDWKTGKTKPTLDIVIKFANYFHVSLDYLVFGDEFRFSNPDDKVLALSHKEQACIKKFRRLNPVLQDRLLIFADGMIAAMPDSESGDEKRLSV